jgi:predicted alpha-1,2-mannosidase
LLMTRRTFLGAASATSLACASRNTALLAQGMQHADSADNLRWVKIAIGTGGHGHCYPGATVPFGAVQLSPDTGVNDWDHCSGYHYADRSILGFSHTHLSGTGCIDMQDFLLMPATDDFHFDPLGAADSAGSYRATFSHEDETALPGYYSVLLQSSRVKAELTATERVGLHRYTFPASDKACFLLDLVHAGKPGGDSFHPERPLTRAVRWASLKVVGNDTIVGGRCTDIWAKGRLCYFAMKFSKPFDSVEIYADGTRLDGTTQDAKAVALRCVLRFKTHAGERVQVKTGISGADIEGASRNLAKEASGWDFDAARAAAHLAWQRELGRIRVRSGDPKYLEIFYTGLYHMMLAPTLFDDVDGRYRGMDDEVHTLAPGVHNYSTYSLWDTFRALHPMYTLYLPERVPDFVNCLIRMAEQSPHGVPIWPLQGIDTGTMVGYHSAPVVAEALVKGFSGIDTKAAYAVFRQRAEVDDFRGLASYRKLGYVPCDEQPESASKTLDYAYDDNAVAAIADAAGQKEEAAALRKSAGSFVNLYDKESGFIRPRYADGHWAAPFNPKGIKITKWRDYTEANAWQTTFCVQHEPERLIEMLGGNDAFIAKLDELFNQSSELPPDMPPDVTGMVGQYAHGNEPSHHIAYLYNYAGAPEKTQSRIHSLLTTMYDNQPDGMAGNEDCGQMSAWFVISALGLYAVDPVSARYDFGTPLFDEVEIDLPRGRKLHIEARREHAEAILIDRVEWNGAKVEGHCIEHATLTQGGTLTFHLRSSLTSKA